MATEQPKFAGAFKDAPPEGFDSPVSLPASAEQQAQWQQANRSWWEKNPMRYDWRKGIRTAEFSREFFAHIDQRFFADAREYMPWKKLPFDPLINFADLAGKDVLEIGVGCGSHAALLAAHAGSFTGIDLTEYAVRCTRERLKVSGLSGTICQMDAERMKFPDGSFDFIWTWGVIHHSANTKKVLEEMARVLRPGGAAVTMVYHRNAWNYYVWNGLFQGLARGDVFRSRSIHSTMQRHTDGALARYYTIPQWRALASRASEGRADPGLREQGATCAAARRRR
ncbi:MAG TPA: class I SAM-dependent methyltransferase [Candidatus Angelobacter sp.]|nr:class I SAM-dependent methyltransferase [Candidatus Angelobacter sp.]